MSDPPNDYLVVSDVEALKALAHPDRLRILRQLQGAPKTAAAVGREVELTPQRVSYHIKKLEAAGLVRFARPGRKLWKEERLYVAMAQHFLVDPAFACDDKRTQVGLVAELEVRFREKRREHTPGANLGLIARRVVEDILDLQPGQTLLILSGPYSDDMVDALLVAAEARGAIAIQHNWGRSYILGRLDAHTEEELAQQDFLPNGLMEGVQAVCQIATSIPQGAPPNDEQRAKLPHLLRAVSDWQRSLPVKNIAFVEISLPSRADFQVLATPEQGMDAFWRALSLDPVELSQRVSDLEAHFEGNHQVVLRDDAGGELCFQLAAKAKNMEPARAPNRSLLTGAWTRRIESGSAPGKLLASYSALFGSVYKSPSISLESGDLTELAVKEADDVFERVRAETGDVLALVSLTVGVSSIADGLTGKASLDSVQEGVIT
jgi:DNA-binding transcriptional ArsR family regulator